LYVREIEVDHTKVRAVHPTYLVNQLLENVVHPGSNRSQVFKRRQVLCFALLFIILFGVQLVIGVSG